MDSEFPSNSQRARTRDKKVEEPKKVERVTTNEVVRRKKSLGKRVSETFVGALGFVSLDVLIPAAKDAVADAVSQGIEQMLFGEVRSRSRSGGRGRSSNGYVSYNRYAPSSALVRREDPRERPSMSRRARSTHDFDEIILATRVEAEEVIDRLFDLVSRYESAAVSDLYEMVGISGNFTDEKWGWHDIRGAGVTRVRNGYLLDLPRPEPLD